MTDKDRQDEDLEKKTTQVDPSDKIEDDEGLQDELENLDGLHTQLLGEVDDKDWVSVLETLDSIQDIIDRAHAYVEGKIE